MNMRNLKEIIDEEGEDAAAEIRSHAKRLAVGQIIETYRHRRQLTQSELARMIGVDPALISRYESGSSMPSLGKLYAVAEALDLSVTFVDNQPQRDFVLEVG